MSLDERLSVAGRTALVTGAAGGIGRATSRLLVEHGAAAIVLVDPDKAALEHTAEEVWVAGAVPHARATDAADFAAMSSLLAEFEAAAGPVELLVNAAGNAAPSSFLELGPEEWNATLRSHVKSTFVTCRLLVPGMVERRDGRIVNVASVAGKRGGGLLDKSAYAAAKAAVNGLTKALAREVAPFGVRVNAVNPWLTDTCRIEPLPADAEAWHSSLAAVPLGRVARSSEIATAIIFLLSDTSSYITGETMNIDGGVAME